MKDLDFYELSSINGGEDLSHDLGYLFGKWVKQNQGTCDGRLVVTGKTVVCFRN